LSYNFKNAFLSKIPLLLLLLLLF